MPIREGDDILMPYCAISAEMNVRKVLAFAIVLSVRRMKIAVITRYSHGALMLLGDDCRYVRLCCRIKKRQLKQAAVQVVQSLLCKQALRVASLSRSYGADSIQSQKAGRKLSPFSMALRM
ncbi:hypothetical protein PP1Y_AT4579 [Novosphingobium sp. PP1Y]|nr:hypothetical protein PP1Y_AT4579 [Novosphingobium sp. PP1Y]